MLMPRVAVMMSCVAFVGSQAPAATQKPSLEPDVGCHVGLLDICSVQRGSPKEALRISFPTPESISGRMQRLDSFLVPPFVADATGVGAMSQNLIQFGQALVSAFEAAERSVQLSDVPQFGRALAQLNSSGLGQAFDENALAFFGSPVEDVPSFPTAIDQLRFASSGVPAAGGGSGGAGSGGSGGTGSVASVADDTPAASGGATGTTSAAGSSIASAGGSLSGGGASVSDAAAEDPIAGVLPSAIGLEGDVDTLQGGTDAALTTATLPAISEQPEEAAVAATAATSASATALAAVPLPLSGLFLIAGLGALVGFRKKS